MATFLELAPYYLFGPLLGLVAYVLVMETAGSRQRQREESLLGRKFALLSLPVAPSVFGLLLLILAQAVSEGPEMASIVIQIGLFFSVIALLTCLGMAYQVSKSIPALEQDLTLFGRNLVLQSFPLTAPVFGWVMGFIMLGILGPPGGSTTINADAFTSSIYWTYAIGVGGLLSGLVAGAVTDSEEPNRFVRLLLRAMPVDAFMVVAVAMALFSLPVA